MRAFWTEPVTPPRASRRESRCGCEAEVEARADMANPVFVIVCIDADGKHVFGIPQELTGATDEEHRLKVGERVRLKGEIENRLTPGEYFLSCWIRREGAGGTTMPGPATCRVRGLRYGHRFGVFTAEGSIAIEVESDER